MISSFLRCVALALLGSSVWAQSSPAAAEKDPLAYGLPVPAGAVAVFQGEAIPLARFEEELIQQELRGGRDGARALESLIDEALIARGLDRSRLTVDEAMVAAKEEELDKQLRAADGGSSLEKTLADQGVPREVFRRKLKRVVALEALARKDLPVPAGKPVENGHMSLWLSQAKESAKIVRGPNATLAAGVVADVDGTKIGATELARELAVVLPSETLVRTVRVLLEERLMDAILTERSLALSPPDFDLEYAFRKAQFAKDPKFAGVSYEEILVQQTGLDAERWKKTREFRIAAGRGLLARKLYSEEEIFAAFEKHQNRYGPIYVLSHILVRASDAENLPKDGPLISKAAGKERIELIRQEIEKGVSFKDAARQYSEDRGSQFRGGVLPAVTPGRNPFEPGFLEAAEALEPGAISAPVWTRLGWHLVRLEEKRPTPSFDSDIRADLERFLVAQLFAERMGKAAIGWDLRALAR